MIESAHKDKKCNKFDKNFQIKVQLSDIQDYEMIERSLSKMPRKVKNSKSKKGRGNSEASGRRSVTRKNKSVDSNNTDDDAINGGEEKQEYEKVMVPVEVLTKN